MPLRVDALLPMSPQHLAELFDRHAAALALYATQWTSDADDCVQEALIELAKQPAAPTNPAAWLYRVVRNRALNASRSQQRRLNHEQAAATDGTRPSADAATPSVELADALAMLDEQAREIVVLRVWGQLSWQEIAVVVEQSKSAAQRDYVAALEKLRQLWEPKLCPNT